MVGQLGRGRRLAQASTVAEKGKASMIYTAECFAAGMAELSLLAKSGECEGAKRARSAAEEAKRYFYLFGLGCHAATARTRCDTPFGQRGRSLSERSEALVIWLYVHDHHGRSIGQFVVLKKAT